jgi:hypothetical protein
MVATSGQQHFFMVEAPSAYVPPHPGSHANREGLYKLVEAPNPSVGEEVGMEAVHDAAAERRLGLDAAEEAVVSSGLGVDLAEDEVDECAVLGTELSLSSRGRMTLGVGEIF